MRKIAEGGSRAARAPIEYARRAVVATEIAFALGNHFDARAVEAAAAHQVPAHRFRDGNDARCEG